jgi:hypothetical protein
LGAHWSFLSNTPTAKQSISTRYNPHISTSTPRSFGYHPVNYPVVAIVASRQLAALSSCRCVPSGSRRLLRGLRATPPFNRRQERLVSTVSSTAYTPASNVQPVRSETLTSFRSPFRTASSINQPNQLAFPLLCSTCLLRRVVEDSGIIFGVVAGSWIKVPANSQQERSSTRVP